MAEEGTVLVGLPVAGWDSCALKSAVEGTFGRYSERDVHLQGQTLDHNGRSYSHLLADSTVCYRGYLTDNFPRVHSHVGGTVGRTQTRQSVVGSRQSQTMQASRTTASQIQQ